MMKLKQNIYISILVFFMCSILIEGVLANDEVNWEPLQVQNVDNIPWDERFRMGKAGSTNGKLLFFNPNGGVLLYVKFNPGWDADGTEAHYHTFHEWGYVLDGSFPLYEFVSPKQKKGSLVDMKQGTFMDRPAFSIHGNRREAMEKQRITPASTQLIFYESGTTVSLDKENKNYADDWKDVDEFFPANFQESLNTNLMEWEDDKELEGIKVKWLSDHGEKGFTARLRYAPANWMNKSLDNATYNPTGYRFMYILSGDMKLAMTESNKEDRTVTEDFLIVHKPMSLWSWGSGKLTEKGVMWLDVEYGKETIIGKKRIEKLSKD